MKVALFLLVAAIVEVAAGLALLLAPGGVIEWILGTTASEAAPLFLARWVGVALIAIGVASALARDDPGGPARRGALAAVLFYDVAVALLLIATALGSGLAGPLLWPAVVLHVLLTGWGAACLRPARSAPTERVAEGSVRQP